MSDDNDRDEDGNEGGQDDTSLIKEAMEKFRNSQDASDYNRDDYYEDTKFARLADQWPDEILKQRQQEGRPALVINKLPALIRSIVNESRQSKPSVKVSPVDNGADEDTAEIIGGIIRSVERNSNASVAYDTAIDNAVTGGFGFFRIDIEYAHEDTFELEAKINRIPNALSVHWDTSSTAFDASDWEYCFISEWMDKAEFKVRWPDASLVPFEGDSRDENSELWLKDDSIRIAEWFQRYPKKRKLFKLQFTDPETQQVTTKTVREEEVPHMAKRFFEAGGMDPDTIKEKDLQDVFFQAAGITKIDERDADYFEVKRRIINGTEVLEDDTWPGQNIPVCPVWGDEVFSDGRRYFRSLIRDAKDPQMMFNFWRSATTELVALAPKTPFIGPKGFVPKGQESKWASANTRSHAYLEYEITSGAPPSRQAFAGVPAGALQESINASDDMKAITGIYDASIGAKSNETSGKAIMARERQGDVSNFHFIDNLNRAIQYCGRILVEIIPAVYSPKEVVRILGEDSKDQVIKLTQEDGGSTKPGVNGEPRLYNLAVGKYDVTVASGPNFATQREETRETLIEIMRQVPDAAPFVGDVLLDHMDFVGADKVAKRLKALLPPEVRQAEEAEQNSDNPEMAAKDQQIQAMQQQMQQAQQQVMQEIERIQKENEALKQNKAIEGQKLQMESQYKGQELQLKDRELKIKEAEMQLKAMTPQVTPEQQWQYDQEVTFEQNVFNAAEAEKDRQATSEQNALDRQAELAKLIIQKQGEGCSEEDATAQAEQILFQRDECGNIMSAIKTPVMPEGDAQ